jgi:type II secretory pathway component PulM
MPTGNGNGHAWTRTVVLAGLIVALAVIVWWAVIRRAGDEARRIRDRLDANTAAIEALAAKLVTTDAKAATAETKATAIEQKTAVLEKKAVVLERKAKEPKAVTIVVAPEPTASPAVSTVPTPSKVIRLK